nr:hypothetical protein [Halomicroarcula sp. SHR3]
MTPWTSLSSESGEQLEPHRYHERAADFSGGMKQRLDAATALVHRPPLVRLTDRPVGNFTVLSAVVLVVMLVPVVAIAPPLGLTALGQGAQVMIHVAVAVRMVAFVAGAVRL